MRGTAYERLELKMKRGGCVVMDGGLATELERNGLDGYRAGNRTLWGTWALRHAPDAVSAVHGSYLEAGCEVVSTATWGVLQMPEWEEDVGSALGEPVHWMDVARHGLRLTRRTVEKAGRSGEAVVAFCVSGDIDDTAALERFQLLGRVFERERPDLILVDTITLFREGLTVPLVASMVKTGIPVWLSFRRCRRGVCGIYGQHWGGPEGDLFGRMAHRFEGMGVEAILIGGIPIGHISGMLAWLRDFTDLPLGVSPILGHYLDPGWKFDESIGPERYANEAMAWQAEGARLIGGNAGVTTGHIRAVAARLAKQPATESAPSGGQNSRQAGAKEDGERVDRSPAEERGEDSGGRRIYPIPFPEIECDAGVFRPTQGSFLIWKFLFNSGVGEGKRCLDVGCGTGILSVQLALNGAASVSATDIQPEAVKNTLSNAHRNGVDGRITGHVVDLYTSVPDEKYDVVVASLYQQPVDPMRETTSLRPADYWGRNMLDHLMSLLPELLAEDGVAYLMQVSVLSQKRTTQLLGELGFICQVLDYNFYHFGSLPLQNLDQIRKVEGLSDAYHLTFGEDHVMAMYLLEVRRGKSPRVSTRVETQKNPNRKKNAAPRQHSPQ